MTGALQAALARAAVAALALGGAGAAASAASAVAPSAQARCSDRSPGERCSRRGLSQDHSLLQVGGARAARGEGQQADPLLAPSMVSPCEVSCPCWTRRAGAHTCGARIQWVMGPNGSHSGHRAMAAGQVRNEYPTICSCSVHAEPAPPRVTGSPSMPATPPPSAVAPTGQFEPVDGGAGRLCRGEHADDDDDAYYTVVQASSLEACQAECMKNFRCKGIEYADYGRCELWTRDNGIGATTERPGFTCMRLREMDVMAKFEPVNGGTGRACRGASSSDNLESFYTLVTGVPSLDDCKGRCSSEEACVGIEYGASDGRCEVWTRAQGIGASEAATGYTCLRRLHAGSALGTGAVGRTRLPPYMEPGGQRTCSEHGCCGWAELSQCSLNCTDGYALTCEEQPECGEGWRLRTTISGGPKVCCRCQHHSVGLVPEPCKDSCPCWSRELPDKSWTCGEKIFNLQQGEHWGAEEAVRNMYPELCTCSA